MPIFDVECINCKYKLKDQLLTNEELQCPKCKKKDIVVEMKRLISGKQNFILKGEGFYKPNKYYNCE